MPFRDGKGSRAALEGASREQGGASREQGGAPREQGGAPREQGRAPREQGGALWGSARVQHIRELAALYPAIAARVIYDVRQHCCLEVSKFQPLQWRR